MPNLRPSSPAWIARQRFGIRQQAETVFSQVADCRWVPHVQARRWTCVVPQATPDLARMQDPQECIRADRHSDLLRQASATFDARLQREGREQRSGAVRPTSVANQFTIEALGSKSCAGGWAYRRTSAGC